MADDPNTQPAGWGSTLPWMAGGAAALKGLGMLGGKLKAGVAGADAAAAAVPEVAAPAAAALAPEAALPIAMQAARLAGPAGLLVGAYGTGKLAGGAIGDAISPQTYQNSPGLQQLAADSARSQQLYGQGGIAGTVGGAINDAVMTPYHAAGHALSALYNGPMTEAGHGIMQGFGLSPGPAAPTAAPAKPTQAPAPAPAAPPPAGSKAHTDAHLAMGPDQLAGALAGMSHRDAMALLGAIPATNMSPTDQMMNSVHLSLAQEYANRLAAEKAGKYAVDEKGNRVSADAWYRQSVLDAAKLPMMSYNPTIR
jgi:hypothetical protein